MARPLSPREATEMILALRRQQGDSPSHRQPSTRRAKRSDTQSAKSTRRTAHTTRDTATEE
jgi:hypothetical protein